MQKPPMDKEITAGNDLTIAAIDQEIALLKQVASLLRRSESFALEITAQAQCMADELARKRAAAESIAASEHLARVGPRRAHHRQRRRATSSAA